MDRRLAAILAADVVGYGRLITEDEEGTVELMGVLRAVARRLIQQNGGRVIDAVGDSILAEFPSVLGAVRSAIALQTQLAAEDTRPLKGVSLRIGVTQGEIIANGEARYGDGVNVAARLQALARPGGIAVSGRVYEDVANKLALKWWDEGERGR